MLTPQRQKTTAHIQKRVYLLSLSLFFSEIISFSFPDGCEVAELHSTGDVEPYSTCLRTESFRKHFALWSRAPTGNLPECATCLCTGTDPKTSTIFTRCSRRICGYGSISKRTGPSWSSLV